MPPSFFRTDLSDQALKAWQLAHPELAPASDEPIPQFHLCHDYDQCPVCGQLLTKTATGYECRNQECAECPERYKTEGNHV